MRNALRVYGTVCILFASAASAAASFAKWPAGMERFIWITTGTAIAAYIGSLAWKD